MQPRAASPDAADNILDVPIRGFRPSKTSKQIEARELNHLASGRAPHLARPVSASCRGPQAPSAIAPYVR